MMKVIKRLLFKQKPVMVNDKIDVVKPIKKRVSIKVGKFKETAPGCLTADVSVDVKPVKKKATRSKKKGK